MRNAGCRALGIVAALLLAACTFDGVPPGAAAPDGGNAAPECGGGCPLGSVCSNGACAVVPATCPCPVESFCDLASNTCKVGCVEDAQCSKGRYCDTANRACQSGCRADGDCQSPAAGVARCAAHACMTTCDRGHHLCGSECADNAQVATCGASCSPCPPLPNSKPSCDGRACGLSCNAGWADCNGQAADGCEHAVTPIVCYQDSDGDGFGDQMVKRTFECGTCPGGWTAKADAFDCYDYNKDVFPGQKKYFCVPYNGTSYDYDCDGKTEREEGQYSKFSSGPCYIEFPMSMQCGEKRDLPICLPGNYEEFTRCCQ